MTRAHAISLSDRQLRLVQQAAASLPVALRDRYLRQIADQLVGHPTDTAVVKAVNVALDRAYAFLNHQGVSQHAYHNQNANQRRR